MSEKVNEIQKTPPYAPWKTFLNFIERLKTTAVPPRIDTSMMASMSGATRSQLMSCLKFLGLIDGGGNVSESLRRLVKAYGTESWKETLSEVIFEAYGEIMTEIDLDSATSAQLDERFRTAAGLEGQMLEKAVRFYLAALDESGTTYSPHFKVRKFSGDSARKKARPRSSTKTTDPSGETPDEVNTASLPGTAKFSFPIPGKSMATIIVPRELEEEDWDMVDAMVRAYVGRRKQQS